MKHFVLLSAAIALTLAAAVDAWPHSSPGASSTPAPKAGSTHVDPPQPGVLEGVVTSAEGTVVWTPDNLSGIHVTGVSEDGRRKFDVATNTTMGGLYHVDKLPAGYYDLKIPMGYVAGNAYQPQEIFAVEIKPNEKTTLNITMNRGQMLNIVGTPVYPTPAAARLAEESAKTASSTAKP